MKKNLKFLPFKNLGVAFLLASLLMPTSCTDKFDSEEGHNPTWLGSNIYDYLNGRGDCKNFVRLINDEGLKDVMQYSGSNTLFFCNDDAFERFYQNNDMGIRSYEQMPESLKKLFLRFGVIENAQLIERLSLSDKGAIMLRRTTDMQVSDTIPVVEAGQLPDNSYFETLRAKGKPVKLLQDGTQWTLVQFFPEVMKNKGITNKDLQFITKNSSASTDSTYLYDNRIVKQDLVCKNGYLHELENVLLPPENMAGYIRKSDDLRQFNHLLERFCVPNLYGKTEQGDSIYELRYFNNGKRALLKDSHGNTAPATLIFDPGWNMYASSMTVGNQQEPYQQTMGCMFAPTNEALEKFFSPTGEGADFYKAFGTWDNVPTTMVADIINSHMKNNFLTALPSVFDKLTDENGYSMDMKESDIKDTYVARNGLVYISNKVFAPQDYKTVMGPAKIDVNNSLFSQAICNTNYSYYAYFLRAPKNVYYFFVTPDKYTKGYVDPVAQGYSSSALKCKLDFYVNSANKIVATPINIESGDTIVSTKLPLGSTGVVSTGMKSRMNDILGTHTVVCSYDGELEDRLAQGQEFFVSNTYAPVHISSLQVGGKVSAPGNAKDLNVLQTFNKSNGRTFVIDGLLQSSTHSIYRILKNHPEFSEFFNICEAIGVFSSSSADGNAAVDYMVKFLNRFHYTVYVPTNDAIRKAQKSGKIPTVSEWENEGDAEVKERMTKKLNNFVKYHFQDNSVFVKGAKESGATYLSATLNESTKKFYPIKVNNTGSAIQLIDNKGQTANVVTSGNLYNLMARDIIVNNKDKNSATEMVSYSYAVIHQIDHVLNYE